MFRFRTPIQHLRFGSLVVFALVGCCVLLAAAAKAQEAILDDGRPALIFRADPDLTIIVGLVDHNGERALRFPVLHSHLSDCSGYLYVSQKHIAYDPVFTPKFHKDAFDLERGQIKDAWVGTEAHSHESLLAIFSGTKRYLFYALFDSPSGRKYFGPSGLRGGESAGPVYQLASRSLSDFENALHDAEQLTASLGQQAKQTSNDSSGNLGAVENGRVTKDFQLATYGSRETISLPVTQPGQLKMSATWGGNTKSLAIILNGPGKGNAYARNDGPSPLQLEYSIRPDDMAKGDNWTVSIVNFNKGKTASGLLSVVAPIQEPQQEQPSSAEEPLPPTAETPPTPPKTISLGQTKDQVLASFGQPQKIANLGIREVYYYPDMKVTFVNGKVTDVQ